MSLLSGGGNKQGGKARLAGVTAELDRLRALPLGELAAEVIARGFDPDDKTDRGRTSVHEMALRMVPDYLFQSQDQIWELQELVGEGVQLLEHARLVQCTVVGTDRRIQWVLTRRGRRAVADGTVLDVIERVA
jgi:hypothetical protein